MRVGVLIVAYRGLADVANCLEALARSTHTDFCVIVRENGGEAAWRALSEALPAALPGGQPVKLLDQYDNLGFAGGVNACLRAAEGVDAYWVLNPDTVPEPDALAAMVKRLAKGDCTMVGHDLVLPEGVLASRGGGAWSRWTGIANSLDHGAPREPRPPAGSVERRMNYVVGASMLVSPHFVERVGLMRTDYFLYCEEVEWCLRGLKAGERLGYAEDAVVLHHHGTSTGGGGPMRGRSRLAVYLQERNRILLTRDLFPSILPVTALLALAHLSLRYAKAGAWRQWGYALQGWLRGLMNERDTPGWMRADAPTAP